jgi:serine/threonine protein kinase
VERHENIVTVLRHGMLDPTYFYFIDMELCAMNLEDYIRDVDKRRSILPPTKSIVFVQKTSSKQSQWQNTWTIMSQIAQGVEFIHRKKHVHRDLKPLNGKSSSSIVDIDPC